MVLAPNTPYAAHILYPGGDYEALPDRWTSPAPGLVAMEVLTQIRWQAPLALLETITGLNMVQSVLGYNENRVHF